MPNLMIAVATGDDLQVVNFAVEDGLATLFRADITARSNNPSIDFEQVVGAPAVFGVVDGGVIRYWQGVCNDIRLTRVSEEQSGANNGLHTYSINIVPTLWFATQRRNYKMFQQKSAVDIALAILQDGVGIEPRLALDNDSFSKHQYRVQYGESDYAFMCRMLEDAGISFYFEQENTDPDPATWVTRLVLTDAPQRNAPREPRLPFVEEPGELNVGQMVTGVTLARRVRPGRYTMRDHDSRRAPSYNLAADAQGGSGPESTLERYHYRPGALLSADDGCLGTGTSDSTLAMRRLGAKRASAWRCSFDTNAFDLAPGVVVGFLDHPNDKLHDQSLLLVIESRFRGTSTGTWQLHCVAHPAEIPYYPSIATPKPKAVGVESATVVGPAGEEIYVDEQGRVRVHFHWDRDSQIDEHSSCWLHVSQPWGGAGYGMTLLPRVGQEVLVDFLGGDPDRPVVVGRVYTALQQTPYTLPQHKTKTGWKSHSTPGGGGFNELSFDDKKGNELVYMQAEKDLRRLVKNNEEVNVGTNRSHSIGINAALAVGVNRIQTVGVNESITVGMDRSVSVGANQRIDIEDDHTITVASGDQKIEVASGSQRISVAKQQKTTVGGAHMLTVKKASAETVMLAKAVTVGGAYAETIGLAKTVTVGFNETIKVGKKRSLTVGGNTTIEIAGNRSVTVGGDAAVDVTGGRTIKVGGALKVEVADKIEFLCGDSKMTLEKSGKVTIEGNEFLFDSKGPTLITGDPIDLN